MTTIVNLKDGRRIEGKFVEDPNDITAFLLHDPWEILPNGERIALDSPINVAGKWAACWNINTIEEEAVKEFMERKLAAGESLMFMFPIVGHGVGVDFGAGTDESVDE